VAMKNAYTHTVNSCISVYHPLRVSILGHAQIQRLSVIPYV